MFNGKSRGQPGAIVLVVVVTTLVFEYGHVVIAINVVIAQEEEDSFRGAAERRKETLDRIVPFRDDRWANDLILDTSTVDDAQIERIFRRWSNERKNNNNYCLYTHRH